MHTKPTLYTQVIFSHTSDPGPKLALNRTSDDRPITSADKSAAAAYANQVKPNATPDEFLSLVGEYLIRNGNASSGALVYEESF